MPYSNGLSPASAKATHIAYLHSEESLSLLVLACPHFLELGEVLLHTCVPPGAHGLLGHFRIVVDVRPLQDLAARLDLLHDARL